MVFGTITRSPGKRRTRAKANKCIVIPGHARRREAATARIAKLLAALTNQVSATEGTQDTQGTVNESFGVLDADVEGMVCVSETVDEVEMDGTVLNNGNIDAPDTENTPILRDNDPNTPSTEDSLKTANAARLSNATLVNLRWKQLLPTLLDSLLLYRNKSIHTADPLSLAISYCCPSGMCMIKESRLRCYTFLSYQDLTVPFCECQSLPQVLVQHGLFPASPSQPRSAFAIDLLDFYHILWRHSCDAITSFSASLIMMYKRCGFDLNDQTGSTQRDPICRPFGPAVQWYDCLQVMLDREMTSIIDRCTPNPEPLPFTPGPDLSSCTRETLPSGPTTTPSFNPTSPTLSTLDTATSTPSLDTCRLSSSKCASILQRLCPCCFGRDKFGRLFDDGGDIHVALDGNLHHRQLASAGEGIPFYTSEYFLSKSYVDDVGERVTAARQKPPRPRNPKVPDESIDQCRESYYAAKGESKHGASEIFRERGLMGLVCRHDVPLLVASIDTPGEQQKYAVALLERLFSLVPESATVVTLYDIGCVLDRSRSTYALLPEEYSSRLILATSVLHAYGHQWPCQLKYNPRLRPGLGLTDGEGTERLWAALRKLIGLERQSSDRRHELGVWMTSKLHNSIQLKGAEAKRTLAKIRIPTMELRDQWRQQQEVQTSVRSYAPLRLKRELGKVLQLQSEVDALEETVAATKYAIKHLPFASANALATLPLLESAHTTLRARAEDLYLSLNISEDFPELKNIPFEYLQLLLLARDLKINIRKRCIGTFFEWDKLDRAVGGRDFALGTKAHQLTRKSISKRAPALQSAISDVRARAWPEAWAWARLRRAWA
ncbi:hypothetical protein E1B28_013068 [Marasmius oreades]|uniref:CxC1-like cysteine cluster associated with KDZ transposases domain-containing protein n=1 Tax=Marasmius oreades TaxID=181124 RepID=A0A9P7RNX3_9AGAR|nr:uncharacterized protein E1B28_013068 [Marasmius oreades]KAG7087086.1 hypothetical protein E1B28_013068 [Marasmius oreades]